MVTDMFAMTYFIGISGKPGSVKTRYRFKIVQELRYHGYTVEICSLAEALYREINALIEDLHALEDLLASDSQYRALAVKYSIPAKDQKKVFDLLQRDGLGDKNPHYGYSRRHPNMRKALSTYAQIIRYERGEDYWIDKMARSVDSAFDFAVFTDLRFPNEAQWLMDNDGLALRVDVDVEQVIAQYGETGGYKYSRAGMSDPTETALDDYQDFYIRFQPETYFDRVAFGKEILDYFDLSYQAVPEDTARPIL